MSRVLGQASFGTRSFEYEVLYAERKTLEIAVMPDCKIVVTAPKGTAFQEIEKRVIKRLRWIDKQICYFKQFQPRTPERQYVSGETHLYLGRQYRLKVYQSERPSVKLDRGFIQVASQDPSCSKITYKLLDHWYYNRASLKLPERFEYCFEPFARRGYPKPTLCLRKMRSRWGSMSPSGILLLNRDLIRSPLECIDYVLMHELCHIEYPDHSKGFYRLMEQVLPDWESRKHRLEMVMV